MISLLQSLTQQYQLSPHPARQPLSRAPSSSQGSTGEAMLFTLPEQFRLAFPAHPKEFCVGMVHGLPPHRRKKPLKHHVLRGFYQLIPEGCPITGHFLQPIKKPQSPEGCGIILL
jgi:hypothetical protein